MSAILIRASVLLTMAGGCTDSPGVTTGEFANFGLARVEGQAVNTAGAPLDSVIANIRFPQDRAGQFTTAPGFSDRNGRFRVEVVRIMQSTTTVDTVTATLVAAASQIRFRKPDGSFPIDTIHLFLRLSLSGEAPVVSAFPRLPVP